MPASEGSPQPRRIPQTALLVVLLALTFVLPVTLMRQKSATFDEVVHLPAGYSYLTTGLFKINPQHPPLIKEICALPLLFMDLQMPVDRETLRQGNVSLTYQWGFGRRFLYSQDADQILFRGRLMAVGLSLGLAILIACWSFRLWGISGALLSVTLYLLDPTVTAHAQLVATDVGLAFFATLFLWMLRRYVDEPNRFRLAMAGITLGLALGAKFSAIILIPIALILLILAHRAAPVAPVAAKSSSGGRRQAKVRGEGTASAPQKPQGLRSPLMSLATMLPIAALVVWAIYFFPSDPWFYLKGLATVNQDHDPGYSAYLMGEMRSGRWYSYFLIAYLVKTPIPELLLLTAAGVLFFRGRHAGLLDEAFLLLPAVVFFIGYSVTADNLGVRYLIPCYPFLMVFTARLGPAVAAGKVWVKAVAAALLVWMVVEFAVIWPDHLAYFNEITGVPPQGSRWLDDSNLDWGQGLLQLREYLAEHPVTDFHLCYFGSASPAYYGVQGREIQVRGLLAPPSPGTYILSAHCVARARAELARVYGEASGNWLAQTTPKAVVGHAFEIYEIR